jgi:hypothetical protein
MLVHPYQVADIPSYRIYWHDRVTTIVATGIWHRTQLFCGSSSSKAAGPRLPRRPWRTDNDPMKAPCLLVLPLLLGGGGCPSSPAAAQHAGAAASRQPRGVWRWRGDADAGSGSGSGMAAALVLVLALQLQGKLDKKGFRVHCSLGYPLGTRF